MKDLAASEAWPLLKGTHFYLEIACGILITPQGSSQVWGGGKIDPLEWKQLCERKTFS